MNRQRIILFSLLTLAFFGVSLLFFSQVWHDATSRFRTGLPVPTRILPNELRNPADIVPTGPPRAPEIRPEDPLLSGSPASPVTVIVYGDFQCEFCREQARALEDAVRLTGRGPDIRVAWRNLPLASQHPRALAAATVSQCAAQQGKFKAMHDALFFQAKDFTDAEFLTLADRLGLKQDAFLTCLRDPAITFRLQQDIEQARTLAITSVPILFVNGTPIEGYVDADTLTTVLRKALE